MNIRTVVTLDDKTVYVDHEGIERYQNHCENSTEKVAMKVFSDLCKRYMKLYLSQPDGELTFKIVRRKKDEN